MNATPLLRRARPLLGTLVEVGAGGGGTDDAVSQAIAAAFERITQLQARLSRFDAASDITRFNALAGGRSLKIHTDTQAVLRAALRLQAATRGRFDITQGRGADGWALDGDCLVKWADGLTFDLGGIAKGYAVDAAVETLMAAGCTAGWVNAGGDLRVFGNTALTLQLRDEDHGGTRPWGRLRDGACATSRYARGSRSALVGADLDADVDADVDDGITYHLSVLAPCCLWADALTKVAALARHSHCPPVLGEFGASVWWH